MTFLSRLRDEPRFSGSRAAPAYGAFGPCCDCDVGCFCPHQPPNVRVTFAGVTNGTKTGCTFANTVHCLCAEGCNYRSKIIPFDGSTAGPCATDYNSFYITLEYLCDTESVVRLTVFGGCRWSGPYDQLAVYELACGSWNCASASHALTKVSAGTQCGTWPATVTVTADEDSMICACECGNGPGGLTESTRYRLTMGAVTTDDTCVIPCGCEQVGLMVCLQQQSSSCTWTGTPAISGFSDLFGSGDHEAECHVMWSGRTDDGGGAIVPNPVTLYFDPFTDQMVVGWYDDDTDQWFAKYVLDALSFDPRGNNTFTYDSGTYDSCILPASVAVDFDADYEPTVDNVCNDGCDICDDDGALPAGWAFTIAGVTGPEHTVPSAGTIRPAEALNGDYCLGLTSVPRGTNVNNYSSGCIWGTGDTGSPPDRLYYGASARYAVAWADMGIGHGVVAVRIGLYYDNLDPANGGPIGLVCAEVLTYEIAAADFDCDGSNVLTLRCGYPQYDLRAVGDLFSGITDPGDGSCGYEDYPATITIAPSTECGPEPPGCTCLPKASYSPQATITGILNPLGGCEECSCFDTLLLCFEPIGETNECTWRVDFTLPGSPRLGFYPACQTDAAYATLTIGLDPSPDHAVIIVYDAGDVALAAWRMPLADFDCAEEQELSDRFIDDDTCQWNSATCVLNMTAGTCPTCDPCDGATNYGIHLWYDDVEYDFCAFPTVNDCEYQSGTQEIDGTDYFVVVDTGGVPARYVRVTVFAVIASVNTIVGVYNYLADLSTFGCGGGNWAYLATANFGQCGSEIDEAGYTEHLRDSLQVIPNDDCAPDCTDFTVTSASSGSFQSINGQRYKIKCWSGGESGEGTVGTGNRSDGGRGGGYSEIDWTGDGSIVSWTVGAGGTGTTGTWAIGGDTSFGTICVAKNASNSTLGTGTVKHDGGARGIGGSDDPGGGGGSSAGPSSNGNAGQDEGSAGGTAADGGTAVSEGGAGGNGGLIVENGGNGQPGSAPGGGGGGADQNADPASGGSGAAGRLEVLCIEG